MGCLGGGDASPEEKKKHAEAQRQIRDYENKDKKVVRLLLLGTGGCGKSTIFKQMKIINSSGYTKEELEQQKQVVWRNVLEIFLVIVRYIEQTMSQEENPSFAEQIQEMDVKSFVLRPDLVPKFKSLWQDKAVRAALARKNQMDLMDNCDYFIENMDRFAKDDFKPTQDDIVRTRVKTIGIVEKDFTMSNLKFSLVDVGGQRNERRKWIHVFDNVTCVIFVASLNEYDQVLAEEETQNRMIESLQLFKEIISSKYFRHTPVIIFFNKQDLFARKIKQVNLQTYFKDYTGGTDVDAGINFIQNLYLKLNQTKQRQIITKVTNATDSSNMKTVFDSVKAIILEELIKREKMV